MPAFGAAARIYVVCVVSVIALYPSRNSAGENLGLGLPDYGRPEMEIVALYPHRRQLSTKVRLFLDMLVDRFAEEQRWLDAAPDR
jgi:DNA-binding transcriptional LysR family regulator